MQRDDPERHEERPTRRRAGRVRLVAAGLIAWGAYSLVTSAIHLVHGIAPLLVVTTVVALVVMSRAARKP